MSPTGVLGCHLGLFAVLCLVVSLSILSTETISAAEIEEPDIDQVVLGPFNADPLTERGISPRVLDMAAQMISQGPAITLIFELEQVLGDEPPISDQGRMNFDPFTDYGTELNFELEENHEVPVRAYRKLLRRTLGTDYWLRQQDSLYDPNSLKVLSESDDDAVISFRYARSQIPMGLGYLTHLTGQVFVEDGLLDRIELTNTRPFKAFGIRFETMHKTVKFGRAKEYGGYLVDQIIIVGSGMRNKRPVEMTFRQEVVSYTAEDNRPIEWEQHPDLLRTDKAEFTVPVKLQLQRKLPLWANDVRKLGFNLPETYGVQMIGLVRESEIDITKIELGGIDVTGGDALLVDPFGTEVIATTTTMQVRADMWVLPFLNVNVLVGELQADSDLTIRLTELGQLVGEILAGEPLPEFLKFPVQDNGQTVGVGLSLGAQYQKLFVSINPSYVEAITFESGSEFSTWVFPIVGGYDFGDVGLRLLFGTLIQRGDRRIEGVLQDSNTPFAIEADLDTNDYLLGIYKEWGRSWNLTAMVGGGDSKQASIMGGYRW